MSVLTKKELREVMVREDDPAISIYMPTEKMGREVQQNPIRFKNLVERTQDQLQQYGLSTAEMGDILQPLRDLELDREFWQHQSDSLAIFLTKGWMRNYQVPIDIDEILVIGQHYHIKPLLSLVQRDGQFWILALDLNNVRLLQASRFSVREVDLEDAPTSLAEAMRWNDTEQQIQWHTGTSPQHGKRRAMYHGHGGIEDDQKTEILRFFQKLDNALQDFFGDEQTPMVLAGVDYLLPIFREATRYSGLVDGTISGSTKMMDPLKLRDAAWEIVKPIFAETREEALKVHRNLANTDQVSADIHEIFPAALFSRVDTLFVARDTPMWGKFDSQTGQVEVHAERQEDDEDLQNAAAVYTILNGGKVYTLPVDEIPVTGRPAGGSQLIAATFRYSEPNV